MMLQNPKHFWKFFNIFSEALIYPETSPKYLMIVDLMKFLGSTLLEKDLNSTWGLFEDFAFAKLCDVMSHFPQKCKSLLEIVYRYCANEGAVHLNVIKTLQVCFETPCSKAFYLLFVGKTQQ